MKAWLMRLLGREAPPMPEHLERALDAAQEAQAAADAYWKARGIRAEDEARLRMIDDRIDRIRAARRHR
jgi:hypothetical protein